MSDEENANCPARIEENGDNEEPDAPLASGPTFVFEASVAAAAATGGADGAWFRAGAGGGDDATALVSRRALLFRAGDYPDKNVTVTVADLDLLVARFAEDQARSARAGAAGRTVPVKAEHRDSALDPLGETVAVYRQGDALYGLLQFGRGMDAHLRERGALNLSVALLREPDERGGGFRLKEVSVVLAPRVAGAGFLSSDDTAAHEPETGNGAGVAARQFETRRDNKNGLRFPFPGAAGRAAHPTVPVMAVAFAQTVVHRADEPPVGAAAGETLIRLRASGRLTPAMEPHARALLSLPDLVASPLSAPFSPHSSVSSAVRFGANPSGDAATEEDMERAQREIGGTPGEAAVAYGRMVAFHVARLLDALPPVQPRAPVLAQVGSGVVAAATFSAAFGDDSGAPIPDAVRQVAESLGADAGRVWRAMAG